jgi:hypothetical protein
MVHRKMNELSFSDVRIVELGAIALAFLRVQNENLSHLHLEDCAMSQQLMGNLRCILSANALESLAIINCTCGENEQLDISGGLGRNQSLKELCLGSCAQTMAASPATIKDIRLLLETNENGNLGDRHHFSYVVAYYAGGRAPQVF